MRAGLLFGSALSGTALVAAGCSAIWRGLRCVTCALVSTALVMAAGPSIGLALTALVSSLMAFSMCSAGVT
eukprot:12583006-Ditylum_brightwellii.AAC.1